MKTIREFLAVLLTVAMVISSITVNGISTDTQADETGAVRYEAEDADSFTQGSADDVYSTVESENYSGGKAVGNMNTWPADGRAYCTTTVTVNEAGTYRMTIGYAGGEENHPCTIDVRVNNGDWKSATADPTSSWDTVGTTTLNIELEAGDSTIDVTGACNVWYEDMGWEWINLDYFELEKIDGEYTSATAKNMSDNGQIRMTGRTLEEGTAMTMDYTTSGFQFVYTGSGDIVANFTADSTSDLVVDINKETCTVTVPAGTNDVTLAQDLAEGTYTVKIYKVTEANGYLMQLNSIGWFDTDAEFMATQESDLKFEFVGDSITCGNQIDSNTGDENGYYAYASVLARAYGADWNTISCSGRGLMEGYNSEDGWAASTTGQLNEIFDYVSYFRDTKTTYDYSYQPDVLVLNVGSNDLGVDIMNKLGTTIEEFCYEVTAMAQKLREKYPDTYIIWCYGTYTNNDYSEEYAQAVANLGDDNMDFVLFPQMTGGKDGHPNYVQHERMAKILSAKISEKLGVENPMEEDNHYELEDGTITLAGTEATVTTIEDWVSVYSKNAYVENMNTNVSHPSNAAYVTVPVTVDRTGYYKVTVSYGSTDTEPVIAVRSNSYEWEQVTGGVGTDWNAIQTVEVTVYLTEGENTIDVTGAINGAWANMDCIELEYAGEGDEPEQGSQAEEETTEKESTTEAEQSSGVVRYEAEDATSFTQGSADNAYAIEESDNYSGQKAVANMNTWPEDGRAYCTTTVTVDSAGTYRMTIGYAGGEENHPCTIDVRVNGGSWSSAIAQPTAGWDTVETTTLTIELQAGTNTVDVTGACNVWYEDMGWEWINLDYFELEKISDYVTPTTAASENTGSSNVSGSSNASSSSTSSTNTTTLGKAKIKKIKNIKGKKVKLTLKSVKNATGYQIKYSLKKNMKKAKTKTTTKTTVTIKKLKKKKTYYFRVRAYAGNESDRVYGKWSAKKKKKITK